MSTPVRTLASSCWECSSNCGSVLHIQNERVVDIKPNRDHPNSQGAFCAKGVRGLPGVTYGSERLLHPLKRVGPRGSGQWEQIGWDEALATMGDQFAKVRSEYGPLAIAGAVSGAFFSRGAVMALLMRSLGSPNWLINQDLCGGCRAVSDRITGLAIGNGEDIDNARTALIVGRNPSAADPVQWRQLQSAKKRGLSLVVIDPVKTPAAARADIWLQPHPGTDAAIALAMINVLIREQRYDRAFVEQWCHGFDALASRASEYTPQRAASLTGVTAEKIVDAARLYGEGPSTFVSGHGIDAFSAGVQTFRAFHALVAISGNLDRPGGNLRAKKPAGFRRYLDLIHDPAFRLAPETERQTLGADRFPLWAGPEGWQTACHNPSVLDAVLTGKPYPVRAMYVSGVNIAVTYPDTDRTIDALRSLDFYVAAAHSMNPTTAWADVVLPKTTTLEEEEVTIAGAGSCVSFTQPAHAPLGEAKSDLEIGHLIVRELATRDALHADFLPWPTQRAFNEFLLGDSSVSMAALEQSGFVEFSVERGNFGEQGFTTRTGKVELYSERLAELGLDPLPNFVAPSPVNQDFPLILLTGEREKNYHHSRFRDQAWARKYSPEPTVRMHPETATEYRLDDDIWVEIQTDVGRRPFRALVEVTDRVAPGVISTGMGWWRPEAEGPHFGALEINCNVGLSYQSPGDPVTGSVDSRGLPCRITRVA
ncbi:MAG: molybdopterin-dependent oxidoreductase [Pseudomonadota bacterium]